MIVQIIGNESNLKEDLPFLHTTIETIHDNGAVIARDWISTAQNRINKKNVRDDIKIDWESIHKEHSEAISRSDLVIIEATNYGFHEGFYTSQAITQKKPVLLLTRSNNPSQLIHSIKHKLLVAQCYGNHEELERAVEKFLKANTISTKDLRFNFFIDRQIYNYLREVSYETGKNKSEIIRELLEHEIDKEN